MIKKILKLIEKNDSISLFMHKRPDGDSISCSYGLALAILEKYPKKNVKVIADLKYLQKNFKFIDWDKKLFTLENKATLAIMGDGCQENRIWYYEEFVKSKNKILFDHHQNKEDIKANVFWHKPNYPASAIQVYEIAKTMGIKFKEKTALHILLGILTDTGFFKYSGNNPAPAKYFSELIQNVSFNKINDFYNRMFIRTKKDLQLQEFIFSKLKYSGRVAYCIFDKKDIEEYSEHEIKMKVNSIGHIEKTDIWLFLYWSKEQKLWKVSMRSKKPVISDVATKWGGGGHLKAAACKVKNKTKDFKKLLLDLNKITKMAS